MLPIIIIGIITGLLFIGIGWVLPSNPNLISGYNTLPKKEKQKVDIKALSKTMQLHMFWMGILMIAGTTIFSLLKMQLAASLTLFIVPVAGSILMFVKSQKKYPFKSKGGRWGIGITAVTLISVIILLLYGMQTARMQFLQDQIVLSGMYGISIDKTAIKEFQLIDTIPAIVIRTNGFAMGKVRKGWFRLEDWGQCRLFLHGYEPPYILIEDFSGNKVLYNLEDSMQTSNLYIQLKDQIQSPNTSQ